VGFLGRSMSLLINYQPIKNMKYKIEITEQITYVNYVEGTDEQDAMDKLLETNYTENVTYAETVETIITNIN
jgi:hypothetical protein